MKVLFITYHYLDGNGGGVYASRAFINAFASISKEIVLIYPDNGNDVRSELNKKIKYYGFLNKRFLIIKILRILFGKIHKYDFYTINKFLMSQEKFDLIVFDTGMMGDLAKKINKFGKKIITIHHNVQIDYFNDNKPSLLRGGFGLFRYWLKRNEKLALLNSNLNLTLTNSDAHNLVERYQTPFIKIKSIGCFEYKEYKTPKLKINEHYQLTFIITGNLGAIQTENSLIPFLKIYYPIMQNSLGDFRLIIAGKDPSKTLSALCERLDLVELIPNPIDMYSLISKADIYICPTLLGSGIKLRVMDGLKMGLPILAHANSVRGYEKFEEVGFLFSYSELSSFSVALKNIIELNKNENQKKIVHLFQKNFSFNSGTERIKKIIE